MKTFLLSRKKSAFSLVEVSLALGIVSFALIAVVGLLPTGLRSIKNANEQAGAANVLNSLADALRNAQTSDSINFTATFAGTSVPFQIGQSGLSPIEWRNLNLDGSETTAMESPRLAARLQIFEAPDASRNPGRAIISVAWSAAANPGWDQANNRWTNADGSLTSGIQFLAKP